MRTLPTLFLLLVTALPAFAQEPDQAVELGADLIEVRAVVTDGGGHAVVGLRASDFELLDEGTAQEIPFFSVEQIAGAASDRVAPGRAATSAADEPVPAVRTIVLFVDNLHLEPLSLARVKKALKRFAIEDLSAQDLLGLVASSGDVVMFGQFGDDRKVLLDAIDAIPLGPRTGAPDQFTPFLASAIQQERSGSGEFTPATDFAVELLMKNEGAASGYAAAAMRQFYVAEARSLSVEILSQARLRRIASMETLKALCDRLSGLPGQRLVLFYSDGFTLRDQNGIATRTDLQPIVARAARAGVVVNAIIAAGLEVASGIDAATSTRPGRNGFGALVARNSSLDTQNGAEALAKATGGELFANRNDLDAIGRSILARNGVYYVLGYYAPEPGGKEYRKIEVRVRNHPEYVVRAQQGYIPTEKPVLAKPSENPKMRIVEALLRPQPPSDLGISVELTTRGARVVLAARIEGASVHLREAGGVYPVSIDVVTAIFDLKGKRHSLTSHHIGGALTAADAANAMRAGMRYTLAVDDLEPGIYQARVVFQETATGRTGARVVWFEVEK